MPTSFSRFVLSLVRKVPFVAMLRYGILVWAYAATSKKSWRISGSPPEKERAGRPTEAVLASLSMARKASSVDSSGRRLPAFS